MHAKQLVIPGLDQGWGGDLMSVHQTVITDGLACRASFHVTESTNPVGEHILPPYYDVSEPSAVIPQCAAQATLRVVARRRGAKM